MASITFQNYFRMYPKLSGMTGTAATEAAEFYDIYKMNVVTIPTNVPVQRVDEEDEFYKDTQDKFRAIAKKIREHADSGQPVLVGTVSIEKSELLSEFLSQERRRAQGAERALPRDGGAYRRAGGAQVRGDDRDQHGGPRHRHPARRQPRIPHARRASPIWSRARPSMTRAIARIKARDRRREGARCSRRAGCSCSAPSATRAAASTTSCAAVRGVRAIRACSRFYLSLDDDLLRIFGPDTLFAQDDAQQHRGRRGDRSASG